jgi:hypothetical protein
MQDGGVCTQKQSRTSINVNEYCALDLAQKKGEIKCRGMMGKEHQWNTWRSERHHGG